MAFIGFLASLVSGSYCLPLSAGIVWQNKLLEPEFLYQGRLLGNSNWDGKNSWLAPPVPCGTWETLLPRKEGAGRSKQQGPTIFPAILLVLLVPRTCFFPPRVRWQDLTPETPAFIFVLLFEHPRFLQRWLPGSWSPLSASLSQQYWSPDGLGCSPIGTSNLFLFQFHFFSFLFTQVSKHFTSKIFQRIFLGYK